MQNTLEKRLALLDRINLDKRVEGFSNTKCANCKHAAFQCKQTPYTEADYVVPAERKTQLQLNSKYWVICQQTGSKLPIGEVSECELYQSLSSLDISVDWSKLKDGDFLKR